MIARRSFAFLFLLPRFLFAQAAETTVTIRGRLTGTDREPRFETAEGRSFLVTGDEPTSKILHDSRLAGRTFEAQGIAAGPDRFRIGNIETRPMVLVDGAKRFRVTYYCDVCSIRTYSPGPCMCCQAETRLDLVDPSFKD